MQRLLSCFGAVCFFACRPIGLREAPTVLICVCKEHPMGRFGSAICVRGHSIRVCIEPDCLDRNTSCPIPGCGSLVAVSRPVDAQLPLSS